MITIEHVRERIAFWQRIMRLLDWDVTVRFQRHLNRSAWCDIELAYKRAGIRILDPQDWPDTADPMDVDKILTHELGHLHFAPLRTKDGSAKGIAEEQAVESYSRALMALYREREQ